MSAANTQLTLDQRDQIDTAKARLRGCVRLMTRLTEDEDFNGEVDGDAMSVVIEDMREAVDALDATFAIADRNASESRRRTKKGGAR